MARQPLRSLRVPDRIWEPAMAAAEQRGESLSAAANRFLAGYGGVDLPDQPWILSRDEVLSFGHVLAAGDAFTTPDDVLYYFEKPYKWDDLHDEWVKLGSPQPPESNTNADATAWKSFAERIADA